MSPAPQVALYLGDSLELLRAPEGLRVSGAAFATEGKLTFFNDRIDAAVTDPPYGFDFAGEKDWDTFEDKRSHSTKDDEDAAVFAKFTRDWSEAIKLGFLRPGGHVLAFSSDRTIDLVGRGLREAKYLMPRMFFWLYASGQVKNPNDTRPGCEPIFVARKPTDQNLTSLFKKEGRGQLHAQAWKTEDGKHPTNVMISEELVAADEELAQVVEKHSGTFFVPKPSPKDRDWGCADLPTRVKDNRLSHMTADYRGKVVKDVMAQNIHPTVKPIELMRRLIRVCSRPGHTIIDPFMGSGTTGVAAVLEGRNFVGIDREPEYFEIAKTRIESAVREMREQVA